MKELAISSSMDDLWMVPRRNEICGKHRDTNSRCHKRRRQPRRETGRMKGTIITMAIVAVLGTILIEKSTAFIVISPTSKSTFHRVPFDSSQQNEHSSPISSCRTSRGRIRHHRGQQQDSLIIMRATDKDNSNPQKNPKKGGAKKYNKGGGPKHKKAKNTKSKQKPLDPSKQKKKEFLEQIKAKIKEEGEEKKRKQSSGGGNVDGKNNKSEKQQEQQQNQNKPKKKKPQKPKESQTQARLQTIADEDPSESAFDENVDYDDDDLSNKRGKKLFMNPFEAGKSFRETLQGLSTLSRGLALPKETKQKYFLDDRLLDGDDDGPTPRAYFSSSPLLQSNFNSKSANSLLQEYARAEALDPIDYIPEVLVVGATGEIGRLVVRRLLLEGRGRFRVRVLVRDLYSQTLNLLGTGVSYCQGDLNDIESLEYSLTDVDKIVYVAGAPKPDETDFQRKFQLYLEENNLQLDQNHKNADKLSNLEWEQMASVLEVRSELAEQVDCIGMKNLVSAYQNVRHTDYGTSQAAKRSLFKFSKNSNDFDLFALDDGDDDDDDESDKNSEDYTDENDSKSYQDGSYGDEDSYGDDYDYDGEYEDEGDKYEDVYDDYDDDYGVELESRNSKENVVKAQVRWLRNKFYNGVFVGRVPKADATNPSANPGGEASIMISRLRAREDPEQGIDMSGFAGFILRMVSDGSNYEAFVRTELYETDGIEYVYEFSTESKKPTADNKSRSRFKTIRLAFENFRAVQRRKSKKQEDDDTTVPPFIGADVRYLGFRFRSSSNVLDASRSKMQEKLDRLSTKRVDRDKELQKFYMAIAYIKVYRAQPEPEFIYLSDARIPPVIRDGMVHHDRKMLLTDDFTESQAQKSSDGDSSSTNAATLLDEKDLQRKSMLERSPEETYFKYRGEEILIKSGLSYTILRVAGFNELSGSEASTIDLVESNLGTKIVPVSRAEVAQVCVSALLDPCALNKCVYMTKKSVKGKNVLDEEDMSAKFEGIPTDVIL